MGRIKEHFLRQEGDHGAETWARYSAQFEYTAYWCIRMLRPDEDIVSVTPEGGEDVVIRRATVDELHQIKTRDEGQGAWTTALVCPILCQQFHRRSHFRPGCHFFFVSNQIADNDTTLTSRSLGPLFRLKELLDLRHDDQTQSEEEREDWNALVSAIAGRIIERMKNDHGEQIDQTTAVDLLTRTHIETACPELHYPNHDDDCSPRNLTELDSALGLRFPGTAQPSMHFLDQVYQRLLRLVYARIRMTASLSSRAICSCDVIQCRAAPCSGEDDLPDLDSVPGRTILDKKATLAGFVTPERQLMHRQKANAEHTRRQLIAEGNEQQLERLSMMLLDRQIYHWREANRTTGQSAVGPGILQQLTPELAEIARRYFPEDIRVDPVFCKGVLWNETDQCRAWWHETNGAKKEGQS